MATLKKLTEIGVPNLIEFEQDQFLTEIINTIKSDPAWNSNFDGELTQNATFMLLNMYAFMFSKNAKANNKQLQELFFHKANSPISIVEGLNRLRINLTQNKASAIAVTGTVQNNQFLESTLVINSGQNLGAVDLNGQPIVVEFLNIDSVTGKPDYINPVTMPLTVSNRQRFDLTVYSGETRVQTIALDANFRENFSVLLEDTNVIDNSIRIYYNSLTELPETTSFVIPKINTTDTRFLGGTPHFIAQYDADGRPTIYFGNEIFGGGFAEPENGTLTIYYRVGGGSLTNISTNSIAESIVIPNNGRDLTINFTNNFQGTGGANRENAFEAQVYAPLRYGRGKQIVNDTDALNELGGQVQKHKVDSPKYSETENTIQLLHAHHFIAPKRNFSSFVFPDVEPGDTVSTYNTKFLLALNDFLNADGIHDGEETELLSTFIQPSILNPTYSFVATLDKKNPLNRTLSLTAFDYAGDAVDRITFFNNNYSGTNNPPDVLIDKAFINTSAFGNINVTTNNNKLKLRFDKINVVELTLNTGVYSTITLRDEIRSKMSLSGLTYFVANANNLLNTVENNTKIRFLSPVTGENSKIEIMPIANSIYALIGLSNYQFAYALPNNGRIFTQNTSFNRNTSEVTVDINQSYFAASTEDLLSKEDSTWYLIESWAQDPQTATGITFEKVITQEDQIKLEKLQTGTSVILKAVNSAGEYIDKIQFASIQDSNINSASAYQVAEPNDAPSFVPANAGTYVFGSLTSSNFDYTTSKLKIKLRNGQLTKYPAAVITGINLNLFPIGDYVTENDINTIPYELIAGAGIGALPQTITYAGTLSNEYIKKGSVTFYFYDNSLNTYTLLAETDSNGNIIDPTTPVFTPSQATINTSLTRKVNYTTGQFSFSVNYGATFPPGVDAADEIKVEYTYHTGNGDNITFQIDTPSIAPVSVAYNIATGDLFTQLTTMLSEGIAKTSTGFEPLSKHSGLVYPPVAINKSGCATTSGSAVVNVPSTTDINVGMPTTGTGIPADSYVVSKTPTSVTLNNNATLTSGSTTIIFNQASITFVQMADAWAFAIQEETGISNLDDYITTNANNQVIISSQQTNTDSDINIVNATGVFNPAFTQGTQDVPYSHSDEVAQVHHWEVVFTRKTYDTILATYSPNPYFPEREALELLKQLNATNRRLLGFENLIKRVEFIPVKISATLFANNGTSPSLLKQQTEDILQGQFSYENSNTDHNIGTGFSISRILSTIGNSSVNTGVAFANIITPTSDIQDTSLTKNRYYFIMPIDLIDELKTLEANNSNLAGLTTLYEPSILVNNL